METRWTNTTSNKDIDQYFEATLTVVFTITAFETQRFPHEITEAYIFLATFNNAFIPFGIPRLVMIDSESKQKLLLIQFLEIWG